MQCVRQFRSKRNGYLLAGFELLDEDTLPVKINVLPLHQNTIFQTLPRIHPNVVDNANFLFVDQFTLRIVQFTNQCLFLFPCKSQTANYSSLFLTLTS